MFSCSPYKKIVDLKKDITSNSYSLIKAEDKKLEKYYNLGNGYNSIAAYYSLSDDEKSELDEFKNFDKEKDKVLIIRPKYLKVKPQILPLYEYLTELETQLSNINNNIKLSEQLLQIEKELTSLTQILNLEQKANKSINEQLKVTKETDDKLVEKMEKLEELFNTINKRIK